MTSQQLLILCALQEQAKLIILHAQDMSDSIEKLIQEDK